MGAVPTPPLYRPSSTRVKALAATSVSIFPAKRDRPFWTSSADIMPAMNDHNWVPISGETIIGISAEGMGLAPSMDTAFSAAFRPTSTGSKSAKRTTLFEKDPDSRDAPSTAENSAPPPQPDCRNQPPPPLVLAM